MSATGDSSLTNVVADEEGRKMSPKELQEYNESQNHHHDNYTSTTAVTTSGKSTIPDQLIRNEKDNSRMQAMKAQMSSMREMIANLIASQQFHQQSQQL